MPLFRVTVDQIAEIIIVEERSGYVIVQYEVNLKENLIRDALIKLGWTPPKESQDAKPE